MFNLVLLVVKQNKNSTSMSTLKLITMRAIHFFQQLQNKLFLLPLFVISTFIFTACNEKEESPQPALQTIASIASNDPNFSILVDALTQTNLVSAVADQNAQLTVFAPTNEAFMSLFGTLGINSVNEISNDVLSNILLYHVLGTKQMSNSLTTNYYQTLGSANSNQLSLYIDTENSVQINGNTKVIAPDIEADNGVIHVINSVLLPPSVVDIATANENFSILVTALVKANLTSALDGTGPFTVFAPTNQAFEALFAKLGVSGVDDLSPEQLTPILLYHVVSGNILSNTLSDGDIPTLNSEKNLTVNLSSGATINTSKVIAADIQGSNGVIHVIDHVLIPE